MHTLLKIFLVGLVVGVVAATETVETPSWVVKFDAVGEYKLPTFKFNKVDSPNDAYTLAIHQLIEDLDESHDFDSPGRTFSMKSVNWTVTQPSLNNETLDYSFTIVASESPFFQSFSIVVQISSVNLTNSSSVKCEVSIKLDQFNWTETESKLILSLSLRHAAKNDSSNLSQPSKKYVQLHNAFVEDPLLRAVDTTPTKKKTLSLFIATRNIDDKLGGGTSQKIYLVYPHFNGQLTHSHYFGIGSPGDGSSGKNTILVAICIGGVVIVAILGLVATFVIKHHRKHYMLIAQESIHRT